MQAWLEYEWTPETVSSCGIMFFIAFGSAALFLQGREIWKNRSALSVSAVWTFIFFFMFLTYPVIGVQRQNTLLITQGVCRIAFYIPILWGLWKFRGFTRGEIILARLLFFLIFLMVEYPSTGEAIYTLINFLGVFGVAAQGVLLRKEGRTGVVSPLLLFAYMTNSTLWMWYTYEIKDLFLFANSMLFLAVYMYAVFIWTRIYFRELRTV
jgi:hypothetical protein